MSNFFKQPPMVGLSVPTRSSSALPASAAPAMAGVAHEGTHDEYSYVSLDSLTRLPPSLVQLHALTSLPSGLAGLMQKRARKGRGKGRLVKDAQIVSNTFDCFGRRPQPTNGLSLEQSIQLEMEIVVFNWISSSATSSVPTYAARVIALSDFSAATPLLGVFDQYRFDQLEAWIEFQSPNAAVAMPDLITAVDLDDGNTPTSTNQVQDHLGALMAMAPAGHYHKWKPHVAVATYSGAFTSYANEPACWIDSASPNVQHFGLKAVSISNGAATSANLVLRAVVTFRAPSIN